VQVQILNYCSWKCQRIPPDQAIVLDLLQADQYLGNCCPGFLIAAELRQLKHSLDFDSLGLAEEPN